MLRASISRARPALRPIVPVARPQWRVAQRFYADEKNLGETVVPNPAPSVTPSNPNGPKPTTISPSDVPKAPPAPETGRSAPIAQPATTPPTGPGSASIAPDPKTAKSKKPKRRLRRFFLYLLGLSMFGYAGGVWYSLVSDNFHDFFTEYIPFAEDAVGYFEEREFRKRFPGRAGQPRLHPQISGENKVTIPSKAGVSPRTSAEGNTDLAARGPHVSAVEHNAQPTQSPEQTPKVGSKAPAPAKGIQEKKQEDVHKEKPTESTSHKLLPKEAAPAKAEPKKETPAPAPAPAAVPAIAVKPAKPIAQIDHLNTPGASEPIVQDVVKILNDIITAINADNTNGNKYDSALEKAKSELGKVVSDISSLKEGLTKTAEEKIQSAHSEFDVAANELVRRWEGHLHEQESHWKEEYENERERLSKSYKDKLQSELETAQKMYEQKIRNQLLEQSISLQNKFSTSVRDRVETERDGRLGKLNELSSSVQELEKLTAEWNSVIDSNLKTQHLVVAVEAVKSALENQSTPKPFVSELAALKEIAADDPVVSAAISSINPTAYQRGIPNSAQLIDRFRRVAQEVRKAALLPEDAGFSSHIASLAMSKVLFKKSGLAIGQDVEAVLARTEVLLEEGDLDGAAREMNGLQGWAKVLSKDWLGETRRVLEVRQALDVIAAEARLNSLLVD